MIITALHGTTLCHMSVVSLLQRSAQLVYHFLMQGMLEGTIERTLCRFCLQLHIVYFACNHIGLDMSPGEGLRVS